jgi:rubredoxin
MSDRPNEKTLAELSSGSYECPSCGYVYKPSKGDYQRKIPPGTSFEDLPDDWRCPVCGLAHSKFRNAGSEDAPSGFQENLKYGFGVNTLTSGQKNLLIFGALALGILFFLSLYTLN